MRFLFNQSYADKYESLPICIQKQLVARLTHKGIPEENIKEQVNEEVDEMLERQLKLYAKRKEKARVYSAAKRHVIPEEQPNIIAPLEIRGETQPIEIRGEAAEEVEEEEEVVEEVAEEVAENYQEEEEEYQQEEEDYSQIIVPDIPREQPEQKKIEQLKNGGDQWGLLSFV